MQQINYRNVKKFRDKEKKQTLVRRFRSHTQILTIDKHLVPISKTNRINI